MERRSILTARRLRLQTTSSVERSRYEDDEAFRYLQAREYGEPQYRRGFLSRKLDAWLARAGAARALQLKANERGRQYFPLVVTGATGEAIVKFRGTAAAAKAKYWIGRLEE